LVSPPLTFVKIKTWGIKWKRAIDKTNDWVAWQWQWANAKIDFFKNLTLLKQIINISKENMEDYHWVMFTHAKECTSLKK
jgi:hypothetical protein